MSVRIHQLAKKIDMENKELLELLQSRGFEVKSVASTIDNISAESLIEEFLSNEKAEKPSEDATEAPKEKKKPRLSDNKIKDILIKRSIALYSGSCPPASATP